MAVTKAGLVALALLTSGCLRFGYAATKSEPKPDAAQNDAGGYSHDGGARDGGLRDAAVSGDSGMDSGVVQQDAAEADAAAGAGGSAAGAGGSAGATDSGTGVADAAANDDDAGAVVVDDNPLIGTTGLRFNDVVGYYTSSTYGDMVLQRHGAEMWVSYPLNDGTITGELTSAGVLAGWWAETPTRTGRNAGEAEIRFTQPNGKIHLAGRWRYQTSGNWVARWELDQVTDGRSPPSALVDAFNHPENFKRHP